MKIKNNSTLYLAYGANLLQKLSSLADVNGSEVKATVSIDNETGEVVKNVDNRIYMKEGKNLNVATNEQITAYGEINGMTFFGLYTSTSNPSTSTGLYNDAYNNGDVITNEGTFVQNSYILGMHKQPTHDITEDGFYTNINKDGYIKTEYIDVTPDDDLYYIWLVGENLDVTVFNVTLTASKYATLGTAELPLTGFGVANTTFSLVGFSADLTQRTQLVDKNEIPAIASSQSDADTIFGLGVRSGNVGWQTGDSTDFYTANGGTYDGSTTYKHDNSSYTPTVSLYFYHSQNLSEEQTLGEVTIRFQVLMPIDDLNYSISYVDIIITMNTALYQNYFYEAAISPGEENGLFTTTETNISNASKFSTYYALYLDNFSNTQYASSYFNAKHVLISTNLDGTPYAFPAGTKITMIDEVRKKYYYYVVTAQDESSGKYIYNFSNFIGMGTKNQPFDETSANAAYYNQPQDIVYENFIFQVDFNGANLQNDVTDNLLLMELQDQSSQTLLGVLGIERETTKYSVYVGKDPVINITGTVDPAIVYLGDQFTVAADINYQQNVIDSKLVYDTRSFNDKMGVKVSIFDNKGNQLGINDLLGVTISLDGQIYYPSVDGTIRFVAADKLSRVLARMVIDTKDNTTLPGGTYTVKVEAFGTPDGICYDTQTPGLAEFSINIINGNYGLKVTTDDQSKIVDKLTGNTTAGTNTITANLSYDSDYENPIITVSLERRDYSTTYSMNYNQVDLADYVSTNLTATDEANEYKLPNVLTSNMLFEIALKQNLMTGTYRLVFKLYDGEVYIGEAYEYIVIK
ncbi:MAG: hypothetical protein FWF46_05700 [Oscillospiraceae bacterium]|nr:hypothetical protein [Oscillospiraceae bacterium]